MDCLRAGSGKLFLEGADGGDDAPFLHMRDGTVLV